jgi:hypothetical protein
MTFGAHPATGQDVIFATQTLNDALDREVLATMPAPQTFYDRDDDNEPDFRYNRDFLLDEDGQPYNYKNFDEGAKRYNPDQVGAAQQGTLGWYYSDNNTLEPLAPTTSYPYTRKEYYEDGSGEPKRVAGPGDYHRLGSGHETLAGTFGVTDELGEYAQLYRHVLQKAAPPDLGGEAIISIAINADGQSAIFRS